MTHAFWGSAAALVQLCRGWLWCDAQAVRGAALRSSLSVLRRESCNYQRQETLSPLAQRARIDGWRACELAMRL